MPDVGEEPCKWSEFFALENMSRARDTPLLRLLGVVVGMGSVLLRSAVGDVLLRFSLPAFVWSAALAFGASASVGVEASTAEESSSLPGDVPNILFNRPPWLEKLLRLLPARLMISAMLGERGIEPGSDQYTRWSKACRIL